MTAENVPPAYAESAFGFLTEMGFQLHERWTSGGQSSRDGWRLSYASATVQIVVVYLDMQLEIGISRGQASIDYWAVDRDLFGRRSGFHGNMFPPQKLAPAIERVAADLRANYGPFLAGEEATWSRIMSELGRITPKDPLP